MLEKDAWLSKAEREELLEILHLSEQKSLELFSSVGELGWKRQPEGGWSVGQIAEHLVISEPLLLGQARRALEGAPNPGWAAATRGQTETVRLALANREQRVKSPEIALPTGEPSRNETIDGYRRLRAETVQFIQTVDAPLKAFTCEHFLFGTVSAYHWLLHLALHNDRHNQQILGVISAPDLPG